MKKDFFRSLFFAGAEGRIRTGTKLPSRDFKSLVSTVSPLRQTGGNVK